jgi:cytochrome c peroxidase
MKSIKLISLLTLAFIFISGTIHLYDLPNYQDQDIPAYITKDNTPNDNAITDAGATLGRVLFYDKRLSANNTISCGSCHRQEFAFSDTAQVSVGLSGGVTGRHSMRLVNARFSEEDNFFWNERALSLEDQSTQPIQDHIEMGFSGNNGDPNMDSLITKLSALEEYRRLFDFVFGDPEITEDRMQSALAQFVRSIQSFDSRFDEGLAQVNNITQPFPNFTQEENRGKQLFLAPPNQGGAGCQGCHRGPEFDIDPASRNNGVISVAGQPGEVDLFNTRAPSLRDLVNPDGMLNGPLMHNGEFSTLMGVIEHYNAVPFNPQVNPTLDPRLSGGPQGGGQRLNLTQEDKEALVTFLHTLTGSNIYTDPKYSDPFEPDGKVVIEPTTTSVSDAGLKDFTIYPNPTRDFLVITADAVGQGQFTVFDLRGTPLQSGLWQKGQRIGLGGLPTGSYLIRIVDEKGQFTLLPLIKI